MVKLIFNGSYHNFWLNLNYKSDKNYFCFYSVFDISTAQRFISTVDHFMTANLWEYQSFHRNAPNRSNCGTQKRSNRIPHSSFYKKSHQPSKFLKRALSLLEFRTWFPSYFGILEFCKILTSKGFQGSSPRVSKNFDVPSPGFLMKND